MDSQSYSRCARSARQLLISIAFLSSLTFIGCGADQERFSQETRPVEPVDQYLEKAPAGWSDSSSEQTASSPVSHLVENSAQPAREHLQKKLAQRKVVYTADMHIAVVEFEPAVDSLRTLVDEYQGYVATHNIDGAAGGRRSGRWKIRIPSDVFDSFHAGLKQLGYPRQDQLDSTEVTEEYIDVQRRIANLQRLESKLREHLETKAKSLDDIFDVERELARVGGETERLQGRLELLKDMTALATINLEISEEEVYEPVATFPPPSFSEKAHESFGSSYGHFVDVIQSLALLLIAITPWLPILIPFGVLVRYLIRKNQASVVEF